MADTRNIDTLRNSTVFGENDEKIGAVGEAYLDDQTSEPTFVTVKTGLFGNNETFVPLSAATISGEEIRVPYTKDFVKDAPNIAADGDLTPEEGQRVYEYYSLDYGTGTGVGTGPETGVATGAGLGTGVGTGPAEPNRPTDRDSAAEAGGGESVVAHEEHLNVGTERVESGRVRLRKHTYTDTERVEVPVQREEIVVERTSIDPNSPEARADGARVGEGDTEETVTLHEDVPVVDKETVATEKVDLGKRTERDTASVQADVEKEQIDVDTEGDRDTRR